MPYELIMLLLISIELLLLWKMKSFLQLRPDVLIRNWQWRLALAKITFRLKLPSRAGAILAIALMAELFVQNSSAFADTPFTTFAFPGTGSPTSRTTPDRIADIFNVKEHGAIGDGSHDDTTNIQSAITHASNNGIIFFPKGTYKTTAPITVASASSLIFRGEGNGSAIVGNFNGFIIDTLSTPYNANIQCIVENLFIQNAYVGNTFSVTANGTWSASGSPVNITLSGANPGIAAGGAVFINDANFSTNSVFVGMITSIGSYPTITLSSTAIASGANANLSLRIVQNYSAGTSWGPISSGTYNSGTGVISLTTATSVTAFVLAGDALPISVSGTGSLIGDLNGTWNVLTSSGTAVTLQGPTGKGALTISGGTYSPLRITMATTPPAGISGQYYIYNYEHVLADRKTNFNIGVATWSGTTLTFTPGAAVAIGSIGASDRLWFAPVAGCVRYSSVVIGSVRDCYINGFIGVTSSEDKIVANDPTLGAAEGFGFTVERCNISNPSGFAALPGQTGIYLQNNSLAYYNNFNTCWCGVRISGTACSVIGGRAEVCYFGYMIGGDFTATNNTGSNIIISALSMESNLLGIYVVNGGSVNINAVGCICNAVNPIGGIYINSINGSVQNAAFIGNFGTGYAIFIADVGNNRGNAAFISVNATNFSTPSQSWRTPTQAWWGTCIQCDNPPLEYTFANLPNGSPAPIQGETYNISDCNTITFLATAAGGGTGATAHRQVKYNAVSAVWQVIG